MNTGESVMLEALGHITFDDGTVAYLEDRQIVRIVYALTTLALTPVIEHVAVTSVFNSGQERLWP